MRKAWAVLVVWLTTGAVAWGQVEARQVENAIEMAIQFLERQQKDNGEWIEFQGFTGGTNCLVTLALLNAGVSIDNPVVAKSLANIRKINSKFVYVVSLQTMVLCAAKDESSDLPRIRSNVQWLQNAQNADGAWYYTLGSTSQDNSNSQFALLALHEAERYHESIAQQIKESTWRAALRYWKKTQNLDGSWGYMSGDSGTGSMTCAGISSVVIASGKLSDLNEPADGQLHCCGEWKQDASVERALAWMASHFSVRHNPNQGAHFLYYMYGLERAGRLTAQRYIGKHDWYREGVDYLVRNQDSLSGHWKGPAVEGNANIGTSLALLFLAKGRRPVLMSKLKYTGGDQWRVHPEDVAHFTDYMEKEWKRDLSWQVLDPRSASVEDLLQSPILFFNGQQPLVFDDQTVKKLKDYVEQGGFIFAEASCNSSDFDQSFRKLISRMFPEPDQQLSLLPPEHAMWRVEEAISPDSEYAGALWGVNVSCRTSIIYSQRDLGCKWNYFTPRRMMPLNADSKRKVQDAVALGRNVVAYATNRELKYKFELWDRDTTPKPEDAFPRGELHLAQVVHSGGSDAAPGALPSLRKALSKLKNVRVNFEKKQFSLDQEEIFDFPVLLMHGRHSFELADRQRKQLKTYVERGGVLLCDSICANEAFARSFRREMELTFSPDHKLEPIPADHPMLTDQFGGFLLKTVRRREPGPPNANQTLQVVERQVPPTLEGIKLGDRYVVLFSPYDISCAMDNQATPECRGYVHEDALKIGVNVVLYALYQTGP